MSVSRFLVFVLCCQCTSVASGKSGFLHSSRKAIARSLRIMPVQEELDAVLTEALGRGHGLTPEEQEAKTQEILPMFESMPKNVHGRISRDAMQYMVQRYFGHEHGWSIKGFDPTSTANVTEGGASLGAKVLKEKLPAYVESVLEQRLERDGFALHDVVTMLVVLERLIFDEGMGMLEDAYYLHKKETSDLITHKEVHEVVFIYMLIYGFEAERRNQTDLSVTLRKIWGGYPKGWPSGVYGMSVAKTELEKMNGENPFADYAQATKSKNAVYPFEVVQKSVAQATQGYGKWSNEEECKELKDTLTDLDRDGTGRVRLVDFYKKQRIQNNWFFEETPDYLRAQGVLDETSASRGLQLIIPNYVQALSNCIEVSEFYSICCLRECDGLTRIIEREIRAPTAEPARILEVVQHLVNERAEEPRNLTTQLVAQLEAVAMHHNGQIPLHGRLFNQWMHYVFPYECPYPQMKAEVVQSAVISEYTKRTSLPTVLTTKEMEQYVQDNRGAETGDKDAMTSNQGQEMDRILEMAQWSMEEELYVGYNHQGPRMGFRGSGIWSGLGAFAKMGILIGCLITLKQFAGSTYSRKDGKSSGIFSMMSGSGTRSDIFV